MTILVVGATGQLGGTIVKKLLAIGKPVRILERQNSPSEAMAKQGLAFSAAELVSAGAQAAIGDLRDRASLSQACQGVDVVITTANTVLRDFDIEGVDLKGSISLIDTAKAMGVKHFIFISAFGSDPNSPDPVMRCKALVEQRLRESGLAYTILAPGVFMEVWVAMVVGNPLRSGQPVTLVGKGDHHHSFVSRNDVADYAVAALDNPAAVNSVINIGGPTPYSWTEIVQIVRDALNVPLPVTYVAPGSPIPSIMQGMWGLFYGMETYESSIDMSQTSVTYGIIPTSMDAFARNFFTR